MTYQLHAQLQHDSFYLADLELSELRLFDQADLVWLILIPRRENKRELIDLAAKDQARLWKEIKFISHFLQDHFRCDKLNLAGLGNVVPQLHIHVIARRFDDPYFPQPPFGQPAIAYALAEREQLIQKIRALLHETSAGL